MKRKLIYTFLLTVIFGLGGIISVDAVTPTKEWCFSFEDETGTITGYMPKNYSFKHCPNDVVIPGTIRGVEVQKIGNKAFMNDGIESVVIPDTVTIIGNMAFASNYLTDVVIPETVTKIGYAAFNDNPLMGTDNEFLYVRTDNDNNGIAEIDKTKLIGVSMSAYELNDVIVPEQVETIGTKAFYGLDLYYIELPEGLSVIENKAFYGSYIIGGITIPSTLATADFSMDLEQVPYRDVVYYGWYDNFYDKEFVFESGKKTAIIPIIYERPEVYYADAHSINYNKIELEYQLNGSIPYDLDKIQIYKYNNKTKKYEYLTYTVDSNDVYLSKGLVAGQTAYYKIRGVVTTPDGKTYYSDFSEVLAVKPIPTTPTKVKATKYKSGVAKITWNKVSGVDGYTLYKYNSKTGKYFAVINTKSNSITNSYGLKKGSGAYYRVKAYKMVNGKKVYSNFSASTYVRV